jgi:putative radical SAM enzyme (TIGR03279 family)
MSGSIKSIEPQSVAAAAALRAGDVVLAINGHALRDVIDAQFYAAEDNLRVDFERDGATHSVTVAREEGQQLGIEFEHPTFDIDIRRCNNLCPFCFVLQNAPRMRRTLYIKDDDYRYSFLFGHYVTLTNLAQEDWDRLAEQRLSPLYVSVHATDLETRRKCLRNATAPDVIEQLRWLNARGIAAHTQMVVTPGLNDGARLDESIRALAALYPGVLSATVVPVGLTKHHKYGHRPHSAIEARALVRQVQAWQKEFQATLGARFVHATDEWYLVSGLRLPAKRSYDGLALQENGLGMVRDFLDEWRRVRRDEVGRWAEAERCAADSAPSAAHRLPNTIHRSATLATATLFAPTLSKAAAELAVDSGLAIDVVAIVNQHLGDTITVAGLLPAHDVIAALKGRDNLGEIVVLPRVMFDHPDGIALDDLTPMQVAQALGRPVALADWMGDVVDALTGANRLVFDPTADPHAVPIVREGGWAVEKYL